MSKALVLRILRHSFERKRERRISKGRGFFSFENAECHSADAPRLVA